MSWNHNTHYHAFVIGALPPNCRRAIDIGCGRGLLVRKLAAYCEEVVGIDADPGCIATATDSVDAQQNTTFINGDVFTHPLQRGSFDFVVAVATLHHLPLRRALERFSDLLRPGGTLVVVGLYRIVTPMDYAVSAAALPISWMVRILQGEEQVGAPTLDPTETLRNIRRETASLLPGAVLRRRFFFRYTILWKKPESRAELKNC